LLNRWFSKSVKGSFILKSFRLIDRCIFKEAAVTFVYTVVSFMFLLYLGSFLKQMEMGLPLAKIVEYTPYILMIKLPFVLPLGFITGYILTFSRLSADREIQIIQVSGIPLARIIIPHLILAGLFSLGACYVYQEVIPRIRDAFRKDLVSIYRDIPPVTETYNKPSLVLNSSNDIIDIVSKQGSDIRGLTIRHIEQGRLNAVTFAEKAVIRRSASTMLTFDMKRVSRLIIHEDYIDHPCFDRLTVNIPIEKGAADQTAGSRYDMKPASVLRAMARDPELPDSTRRRAGLQFWMRIALALSCFTFTLFAIPSGIKSQDKSRTSGFVLSILYALVIFFPLLMGLRTVLRDQYSLPAYLVLIPNLLFILYGSFSLLKVCRR